MTVKRILGFVFIILAAILSFAIVGLIGNLFGAILNFFKIFTGRLDAYEIAYSITQVAFWILHFSITIALWKYGIRWSKKTPKAEQV